MKKTLPLNLEDLVESYAEPAVLISDEYVIQAANKAYLYKFHHQKDHDSIIGQHCYQVSHNYAQPCDREGESCPLQLAQAAGKKQRVLHVHHTKHGQEHVDIVLSPLNSIDNKKHFLETMSIIKHASPRAIDKVMVGNSQAFNQLLALINRVAPYEISVLLQGESGTGKELASLAIHNGSKRNTAACVTVECSGLSEALFESELFGHEKGAFTGAIYKKKGLVEQSHGGTLFLDEIGDVPLSLQVKLLRLIETRTYRRVGGVELHQVDFRLICATHKNIKEMVKKGQFREDLYYRISTFPIHLPALRERKEDIPLLIDMFVKRICPTRDLQVSDKALYFFSHYDFPGNIRELRNLLERCLVMVDDNLIDIEHLPEEITAISDSEIEINNSNNNKFRTLEQVESDYLQWASHYFKGDNKALAATIGISERTLYRKLSHIEKQEPSTVETSQRTG
jgi:transcriptional regulator with PAS, ATPase and Fis domain